jgi:predicted GTPase
MGYGARQVADLAATLDAAEADLVLSATPIDLTRVLTTNKPITRVRYELAQVNGKPLATLLEPIVEQVKVRVGSTG